MFTRTRLCFSEDRFPDRSLFPRCLGNATNPDLVRIEWPSGAMQELRWTGCVRGQVIVDLTQAFFARLLEKNYAAQANRERGRVRTYLLAALTHFLADEWDKMRRRCAAGLPKRRTNKD